MTGTLPGGNMGTVRRVGDTIVRPAGPWTPAVHDYLRLVRAHGIREAPEPLRFDAEVEVLSFVPGEVPVYPLPDWVWSDDVLRDAAGLLRRLHDATAGDPLVTADRTWREPPREPREVIRHGDFAPHNLVFDAAHRVVGVIDVDFAGPGPRLRDLAQLATRVVPLESPAFADRPALPADETVRRLDLLLKAYGSIASREELMAAAAAGLDDLALFSDAKAVELDRPELAGHAEKYRADAAFVRAATPA